MIWSLFKQNDKPKNKLRHPILPSLDETLYPLHWYSQDFVSANDLLLKIIESSANITSSNDNIKSSNGYINSGEITHPNQEEMSRILYGNDIYQQWINFTVFGRYVQRSFVAFYRQSEDIFNSDMPDLLRHELMRHAQYLPNDQTLFFAGQLPLEARANKLFTTTLNPVTAFKDATFTTNKPQAAQCIINQVTIKGLQVLGFAVKHNARTSERLRNEVMILNFQTLKLTKEKELNYDEGDSCITFRFYELS